MKAIPDQARRRRDADTLQASDEDAAWKTGAGECSIDSGMCVFCVCVCSLLNACVDAWCCEKEGFLMADML